ncbi:hypothetical protein UMC2_34231 [[Clostridium] sordellii]|uniref:SUKH-4 family immunity protein n=1 Tax=Paraclostridium sordellii TaxID=1505 RepID=UPI0005429CAA|nr:SUKH-4 family immunity protein [Paeniclostridium sordellii]CEK36553.1 hypothetical protein UMC2_34231 [[Clostridium] sordellii] [Paeniclostridium sordellii]
MISSNEFKEKWNTKLCPLIEYDKKIVDKLNIPLESKTFLIEAGLPEVAAPFLSFERINKGALLQLEDNHNIGKDYIYLGFTGNGDILTIEDNSGIIIVINHETYEKSYVNNSIQSLAESLLEYSEFVKKIKKVNGRKAYLNGNCSKEDLEDIKNKLISIDDKSINNSTFWWNEINLFY